MAMGETIHVTDVLETGDVVASNGDVYPPSDFLETDDSGDSELDIVEAQMDYEADEATRREAEAEAEAEAAAFAKRYAPYWEFVEMKQNNGGYSSQTQIDAEAARHDIEVPPR